MIAIINSNNHIVVEIAKDGTIKADVQGTTVDALSNMLVSTMKSFKELGLNKEDLIELITLAYNETSNS